MISRQVDLHHRTWQAPLSVVANCTNVCAVLRKNEKMLGTSLFPGDTEIFYSFHSVRLLCRPQNFVSSFACAASWHCLVYRKFNDFVILTFVAAALQAQICRDLWFCFCAKPLSESRFFRNRDFLVLPFAACALKCISFFAFLLQKFLSQVVFRDSQIFYSVVLASCMSELDCTDTTWDRHIHGPVRPLVPVLLLMSFARSDYSHLCRSQDECPIQSIMCCTKVYVSPNSFSSWPETCMGMFRFSSQQSSPVPYSYLCACNCSLSCLLRRCRSRHHPADLCSAAVTISFKSANHTGKISSKRRGELWNLLNSWARNSFPSSRSVEWCMNKIASWLHSGIQDFSFRIPQHLLLCISARQHFHWRHVSKRSPLSLWFHRTGTVFLGRLVDGHAHGWLLCFLWDVPITLPIESCSVPLGMLWCFDDHSHQSVDMFLTECAHYPSNESLFSSFEHTFMILLIDGCSVSGGICLWSFW